MDDRFLTESRRDPDTGFARSLRARLRAAEDAEPARATPRWRVAFAGAMALAAFAALFMLPAVRATAQQVLDLFRVRDFAVVTIDANRMEQLKAQNFDVKSLLGAHVEKLIEPGPPQGFTSIEAATAAAGFAPVRPTELPRGLRLDSVYVRGEARQRVTVDTQPLRDMMAALDIRDLTVPPGLDGQQVTIYVPRVMAQKYRNDRRLKVAFIQANSPEVGLPPGVDLARFGEIGLRVLGLKPAEANRLAHSIDWRSTLLVPVAANASTFQLITVNGARGLYLENSDTHSKSGEDDTPGAVVLWSREGKIYALAGDLDHAGLVAMAESVR